MDNFAISTEGVAQALQRSASALNTAGNDLYQSSALAAAGNTVVQDPESVGAGLRTIALRLTGTKAGAEELTQMGEETDGMITTESKLRKTIMDATKVASNSNKGFDILDKNGNYKSTYEMMQGISDIYTEIGEKDKKTHSNNLNLLLETMAGKNRSQIAASILQNPDVLKSSYDYAKNKSAGVAQNELDKKMESIDTAVTKFQNSLQSLAFNAIDSKVVKGVVNFGSTFIGVIDKIITKTNTLEKVFIGLGVYLSGKILKDVVKQTNLFGKISKALVPYSKADIMAGDYKSIPKRFKEYKESKLKIQGASSVMSASPITNENLLPDGALKPDKVDEYAASINGLNQREAEAALATTTLSTAQKNQVLVQARLAESSNSLTTAKIATIEANANQAISNTVLTDTQKNQVAACVQQAIAEGDVTAAKLEELFVSAGIPPVAAANIAAKIAEEGATMSLTGAIVANTEAMLTWMITNPAGWIMLLVTAIGGGIMAFDHFNESTEEANERIKEAISTGDQAKKTIDETAKSASDASTKVDELGEKYAKLSQGVNQFTNANISLSNEDYDKFLEISKELAELFPDLVTEYDSNGNAILDLSGNVDTVTASLKKMVDAEKEAAKQKVEENFSDYYTGQMAKIEKNNNTKNDAKEKYDEAVDTYKDSHISEVFSGYNLTDKHKWENSIETNLKKAGIDIDKVKKTDEYSLGGGNSGSGRYTVSYDLTNEQLQTLNDNWNKIQKDEYDAQLAKAEKENKNINKDISLEAKSLYSDYSDYENSEYKPIMDKLSQQIQWDSIKEIDKDSETLPQDVADYIEANVITPFTKLPNKLKKKVQGITSIDNFDGDIYKYLDEVQSVQNDLSASGGDFNLDIYKEQYQKLANETNKNIGEISGVTLGGVPGEEINAIPDIKKLNEYMRENGIVTEDAIKKWNEYTKGAKGASQAINQYIRGIANGTRNTQQIDKIVDGYRSSLKAMKNSGLKEEQQKLKDWGLPKEYNVYDPDSFSQTKFGNIDMNDRDVITWTKKLKEKYKKELDSWNYTPEVGGIDTVFGGSEAKTINGKEYEVAFSPILQTEKGSKFLSQDTLSDYIDSVIKEGVKQKDVSEKNLLKIDAEGTGQKVGKDLIKGMLASIDDSSENNKSVLYGSLMHFSGDDGAIKILYKDLGKAADKYVEQYNKVKELADAANLSVSNYLKEYDRKAATSSVDDLWDSEDFKETRTDLEKLAATTGITSKDIDDLAESSTSLSDVLDETGFSSDMLATCFNNMSIKGKTAFESVTADAIEFNKTISKIKPYLDEVDDAYAKYQKNQEVEDYDAQYNNYQQVASDFEANIKSHNYGRQFRNQAEFLMGSNVSSLDDPNDIVKKYKNVKKMFVQDSETSTDPGAINFVQKLYKDQDFLKGLNTSITKNSNGGLVTKFDTKDYDAIAKHMGITKDAVISLVEALQNLGGATVNFNMNELKSKVKDMEQSISTDNGKTIVSLQTLNKTLEEAGVQSKGERKRYVNKIKSDKNIDVIDYNDISTSGVKSTLNTLSDKNVDSKYQIDYDKNANVVGLDSLVNAGKQQGMSEKQIQAFATAVQDAKIKFTNATGVIYNSKDKVASAIKDTFKTDSITNISTDFVKLKNSAKAALKQLDEKHKISIDFSTDSEEDQVKKLDEMQEKFDTLVDEDGNIQPEVDKTTYQNSKKVLAYLLRLKQKLNEPSVMKIDTSKISDKSVAKQVKKIQEYKEKITNINYKLSLGNISVEEAKKQFNKAKKVLKDGNVDTDAWKIDVKATGKVDKKGLRESLNSAVSSLEKDDSTLVSLGVDSSAIADYKPDDIKGTVYYEPNRDKLDSFKKDKSNYDIKGAIVYYSYKQQGSTPNGGKTDKGTSGSHQVNGNYLSGRAHANGVKNTLVGELGEELLVNPQTGSWQTIGSHGAEFIDMPKDGIVFNHKQTKKLLSNKSIGSRGSSADGGKSINGALANGNAFVTKKKEEETTTESTISVGTQNAATKTTKKSGKSDDSDKKKENKDKKTSYDAFEKWLGKLFDWIEVRLTRLQTKLDTSVTKAEDALSYITDNATNISNGTINKKISSARSNYTSAISTNQSLISANQKGSKKYASTAESVLEKGMNSLNNSKYFNKKGKISQKALNKKMQGIKDKVANGTIDISSYGEKYQNVINSYKDYYDRALECSNATYELAKSQQTYRDALYNLPLDKASAKIEKLSSVLDILSAKADAISGGNGAYKSVLSQNIKDASAKTKSTGNAYSSAKKEVSTNAKALKSASKNKSNKSAVNKAIKNGTTISTKGLSGKQLAAAKKYNASVNKKNTAGTNYANAKSYESTVRSNYSKDSKLLNSNEPSYVAENKVLQEETDNSKSQMQVNLNALNDTNQALSKAKNKKNSADSSLNSATSKLTGKAKSRQKDGKEINTKGLKGKELKQAQAYNKALKAQKNATKNLTSATKSQAKAQQLADSSTLEYTKTLSQNTQAKLDNIEASYQSKIDKNNAQKDSDTSTIENKKLMGEKVTRADYKNIQSKDQDNITLAQKKLEDFQKQFNETKGNLTQEQIEKNEAEIINLQKNLTDAKTQAEQDRRESIQSEIDNNQENLDLLQAQNDLLQDAASKNKNIDSQIEDINTNYDLQIEQENDLVKKAILRAKKEKEVNDKLKEQLDNIKAQTDMWNNFQDSYAGTITSHNDLLEATGKDSSKSKGDAFGYSSASNKADADRIRNNAKSYLEQLQKDSGYNAETGTVYADKYDFFMEGMTEYWKMLSDADAKEAQSAKDAYSSWESYYLTPRKQGLEDLQTSSDKINASMSLNETKGIETTDDVYRSLINNSEQQISNMATQNDLLREQQKLYDVGSDKYREIQGLIDDNDKRTISARENQEKWNQEILNIPLNKLQKELDLLDSIKNKNKATVDLKQATTGVLDTNDYFTQIDDNSQERQNKLDQKKIYENNLAEAMKSSDGVFAGHDIKYWKQQVNTVTSEVIGLDKENVTLKNSLRDDVYWRPFNKMKEYLEQCKSIFESLNGLIEDEMVYNEDGSFTNMGVAKLGLLVEKFDNAKLSMKNAMESYKEFKKQVDEGLYTNEEDRAAKSKEVMDGILSSMEQVQSVKNSILSLYKNKMQEELNSINKAIDARTKLLQKTKSYYDYAKNIKKAGKEVTNLQSQLNALNGVDTDEANALRKQLQEQLNDKKDDLQDTVDNHILELSTDGLSDIKDELQNGVTKAIEELSKNFEEWMKIIAEGRYIANLNSDSIKSALSDVLGFYGMDNGTDDDLFTELAEYYKKYDYTSKIVNTPQYASGTKSVNKKENAWTQENGSEIIVRKSDGAILTPLEPGDGVIPNNLTSNLYSWGALNPQEFMKDMNGKQQVAVSNTPVQIVNSYDSLLKVEGNVDKDALPNLETILQKSYEFTSKQTMKDMQKAGFKTRF